MKALIVKLSSMGDLVQALPAVTDAAAAIPGLRFDWVADEAFAEVAAWHPAVERVITSAHRRWKREFWRSVRSGELRRFWQELRGLRYDRVIDAQTNHKSALVTLMSRGLKCGPDRRSVREPGAHLAYRKRFPVARDQLAVDRLRQIFSRALDYPLPDTPPDFGLARVAWPDTGLAPAEPYLVFVTNASWPTKCWPDDHWRQLLTLADSAGYRVLLPWGSADERERAERLAVGRKNARVLPRLDLTSLAGLLAGSAGAVCNDTGLAHIAAALDVPTVTFYGPTDPALIGATGTRSKHLAAQGFACAPCYRRQCQWRGYSGPVAQCLGSITAGDTWRALQGQQQPLQQP